MHGQGPPLVLVHGGLGDGEISWNALLPHLCDSFTCYLMSLRGRGLSSEPAEPDYSFERHVEDVVAFTESIGEPVGMVGYSLGGVLGLGAAARADAIRALAVYEPGVMEALREETAAVFAESSREMASAAAEGRLVAAARALLEPVAHEDEMAALTEADAFESWSRNVPVALQGIRQATPSEVPGPTDPSTLAGVQVPVLYLLGSRARTWHRDGARYLSEHLDDFQVAEIPGVGHFAPLLAPEAIANELIRFFTGVQHPAPAGGVTRGGPR